MVVKLDGSIIDDKTNYFSREVIDAAGNRSKEKIEGSDFTGSRVAALVGAIGMDNVEKMLGRSIDSISDMPAEVIASAMGCSIESAERMKAYPSTAPDLMTEDSPVRAKLLGELLMYENGVGWDADDGRWSGGSVEIPGLRANDSLGVNLNENGTYEFFTAGMNLHRDDDAFDTWKDGDASSDYDVRDNTSASIWKRDLFSGESVSPSLDGAWNSIDKMSDSTVTVDGHTYKGNTIVSDYFKMHMIDYNGPSNYGVNRVGVLTNAYILNGGFLLKNGTTITDSRPWYLHPFGVLAGSEGCVGPMSSLACKGLWYIFAVVVVFAIINLFGLTNSVRNAEAD